VHDQYYFYWPVIIDGVVHRSYAFIKCNIGHDNQGCKLLVRGMVDCVTPIDDGQIHRVDSHRIGIFAVLDYIIDKWLLP